MEDLARIPLAAEFRAVGRAAAQEPVGHTVFGDGLGPARHAGLPEIFLRQHIDRHLGPLLRRHDVVGNEYGSAVGITDFAVSANERNAVIGRGASAGVVTLETQASYPRNG